MWRSGQLRDRVVAKVDRVMGKVSGRVAVPLTENTALRRPYLVSVVKIKKMLGLEVLSRNRLLVVTGTEVLVLDLESEESARGKDSVSIKAVVPLGQVRACSVEGCELKINFAGQSSRLEVPPAYLGFGEEGGHSHSGSSGNLLVSAGSDSGTLASMGSATGPSFASSNPSLGLGSATATITLDSLVVICGSEEVAQRNLQVVELVRAQHSAAMHWLAKAHPVSHRFQVSHVVEAELGPGGLLRRQMLPAHGSDPTATAASATAGWPPSLTIPAAWAAAIAAGVHRKQDDGSNSQHPKLAVAARSTQLWVYMSTPMGLAVGVVDWEALCQGLAALEQQQSRWADGARSGSGSLSGLPRAAAPNGSSSGSAAVVVEVLVLPVECFAWLLGRRYPGLALQEECMELVNYSHPLERAISEQSRHGTVAGSVQDDTVSDAPDAASTSDFSNLAPSFQELQLESLKFVSHFHTQGLQHQLGASDVDLLGSYTAMQLTVSLPPPGQQPPAAAVESVAPTVPASPAAKHEPAAPLGPSSAEPQQHQEPCSVSSCSSGSSWGGLGQREVVAMSAACLLALGPALSGGWSAATAPMVLLSLLANLLVLIFLMHSSRPNQDAPDRPSSPTVVPRALSRLGSARQRQVVAAAPPAPALQLVPHGCYCIKQLSPELQEHLERLKRQFIASPADEVEGMEEEGSTEHAAADTEASCYSHLPTLVSSPEPAWLTPDVVQRCLNARKGDVAGARDLAQRCHQYRMSAGVDKLLQGPSRAAKVFPLIVDGFTHRLLHISPDGHAVVLNKMADMGRMAKVWRQSLELSDLPNHFSLLMEVMFRRLAPQPLPGGKMVMVIDFKGLRMGDMFGDGMTMSKALSQSAVTFPERLEKALLLNTPSWFTVVWKLVLPLLDPSVHHRVAVVPRNGDAGAELRKIMPDDLIPAEYGGPCKLDLMAYPAMQQLMQIVKDLDSGVLSC